MRSPFLLAALLMLPNAAGAVCLITPLSTNLRDAKVVFVATLTDAKLEAGPEKLRHGTRYKIFYSFVVRDPIKGNSSTVHRVYASGMYNDPSAATTVEAAEQVKLVPGDNVLVISSGERDVEISFCGPSSQWEKSSHVLDPFRSKDAL